MWSLYKKTGDEGIFDFNGEELKPLKFSNGKTQEDVVKEILNAIEKGNKLIFIRGACGSGKSGIALNLARHFKKTSIIVPIKSLQEQYENDYTKEKFILKKDSQKLKISIVKGRNNFRCPYSQGDCRCDDEFLPCTIELREKNFGKILDYVEQNPNVSKLDFSSVSDVKRMSIAPVCPYWSPLLPSEANPKNLEKTSKKKFMSSSGKEYALFQRKKGCGYYDQYESYSDSDVLIFNSQKYLLESALGRKPRTDIEIIDECDEFLDNFANEKRINLSRLLSALSSLFPDTQEKRHALKEMAFLLNEIILKDNNTEVEKIKETELEPLFDKIFANPYLAEDDENNYYNSVLEIAKSFENLMDETYVNFEKKSNLSNQLFSKKEDTVYANLVSINLAQKFQEIIDSNNVLVLMSGTLHSEEVLKHIFGLDDFKIIDAETSSPGTVVKLRTGKENNCKYENFKNNIVTRKSYLEALSLCLKNAKTPVLIHVNSFEDLPSEAEKKEFNLDNLITRERLREMQNNDKSGAIVDDFKSGETDVLFTTKCSRGIDFPGEKCNSIILTKYPYPNIQGLFWKILKKEKPDKFMEFYLDKAKRELIQKISRGLRFKEDKIYLLSPDLRVLDARLC